MKKITVLMLLVLTMLTSCHIEREYYDIKKVELIRTYEGRKQMPRPYGLSYITQVYSVYNITLDNDSIVELTYEGENMDLSENCKIEIRNNDFSDPSLIYVIKF